MNAVTSYLYDVVEALPHCWRALNAFRSSAAAAIIDE